MMKFHTKHDMRGQVINTVACTVKVQVPDSFTGLLNDLRERSLVAVRQMLAHRDQTSSKYYSTVPCVVAKSLATKYQKNQKCKSVSNIVIPICGDKGKIVKITDAGIRIPAITKKVVIPVAWEHMPPVVGFIRSVEFLQRKGAWYLHLSYNRPTDSPVVMLGQKPFAVPQFKPTSMVGVDRNSVGAVATLADPQTGKVLHLGFNPARTKESWRGRKANLQSLGKMRLLHKIRNKQSRRTKHENHLVSKQIVDYAATHRRCIVLEKLDTVRKGKIRRYSEKSQWSFYQLLQYILYKAALRGVMVIEADPAYTSQECSRCHQLTKPNGKSFRCAQCGHNDHRDANAAFTLSERVSPIGGVASESESRRSVLLVAPFTGTEVQQCA
jgi:IS605 OrfB family transposase